MARRLRAILSKAAPLVVGVALLVAFSAFHARRSCDATLAGEFDPPPHHSTRFVLYPAQHMDGMETDGVALGWVVTYAPRGKTYGTAFFVTLLGRMTARGEPAIVARQREQAHQSLERFRVAFGRADAAVPVGSTFSNAILVLGEPILTETNADGTVVAHFDYMPPVIGQIRFDWLTNGFTLLLSNNFVLRKDYSYTSSR